MTNTALFPNSNNWQNRKKYKAVIHSNFDDFFPFYSPVFFILHSNKKKMQVSLTDYFFSIHVYPET